MTIETAQNVVTFRKDMGRNAASIRVKFDSMKNQVAEALKAKISNAEIQKAGTAIKKAKKAENLGTKNKKTENEDAHREEKGGL